MMWYIVKTIIAALIIVSVTEISRFSTQIGGVIKSLPLISIISFIWIYYDTHDTKVIADLSLSTLWYVLPTLPMFYILPVILNKGVGFYMSLFLSVFITLPGYLVVSKLLNS
jgi:hypothetical protein